MALTLTCDGCGTPQTPETIAEVGRLAPVFYCLETCLPIYLDAQRREDAERVRLITEFEAWRTAERAILLETLKGLPDE